MMEQPRVNPYDPGTLPPPPLTIARGEGPSLRRPHIDRGLVEEGQRAFDRVCAACHGVQGDGNSVVATKMVLRAPPSLMEPRLRALSDQQIHEVVDHGYGLMPPYVGQMTYDERWAVVAYVRALQIAAAVPVAELPAGMRGRARQGGPVRTRAVPALGLIGAIGIALGCAEIPMAPRHALFAYVAAFMSALGIALGALLFVMIAHTARARWFVVLRRVTGALASTMPLFLFLFIPIALYLKVLYPWARPLDAIDDPELRRMVEHNRVWMNPTLFIVRSYVYLGLWAALALVLRHESVDNDERPSQKLVSRERLVSSAGLPVVALTLTFASFDWLMPLSPLWSSDMFGFYLFAGCLGSSIGATCVAAWLAWHAGVFPEEVKPDHFHALGRVLFVGVISGPTSRFVSSCWHGLRIFRARSSSSPTACAEDGPARPEPSSSSTSSSRSSCSSRGPSRGRRARSPSSVAGWSARTRSTCTGSASRRCTTGSTGSTSPG